MDIPTKEVSSLSELPKYNNRSIDLTRELDFSQFTFSEDKEELIKAYLRIARGIGYMFDSKGFVEVVPWVYSVNLHGKVIHYQVNVQGRDATTGQLYSVYLM